MTKPVSLYRGRDGAVSPLGGGVSARPRRGVFAVLILQERLLVSWPKGDSRAELPGGGVDTGETDDMALIREVYEETGLHFPSISVLRAHEQTIPFYALKDREHWDYTQKYCLLDPFVYQDFIFEGQRSMPEDGLTGWIPLRALSQEVFHVFHYQALKTLGVL